MHDELLEHEMALLSEQRVILVCPHFGNVSFSYTGELHIVNDHPVLFHLLIDGGSTAVIFTVQDVKKLEKERTASKPLPVIRLKGPHEYRENYELI